MINITFIKSGNFDVSQIPEQWRDFVTVQHIPLVRPVPQAGIGDITVRPVYNSRVSIGVQPDDSSYRYRSLMQPRQIMLKFSLPFYFEFPVGSSVSYEGQTFYFKRPQDLKKQGERNIEYSITMYADDANLGDYKIRNTVDGRLKWSMCARPHEFIEEIVKNLNMREGANKWKVGTCIESTEKTVEFNHTYLDAALSDVASVFETEYEITPDFVINLHKVEYNKTDMLPLSYGRGNGFVPGVGRTSEQGGEPVKRMYAQGGERNIDRSTYGDLLNLTDKPGELLLPLSQSIRFDGEYFEGDDGFNAATAHTYKSDAHGYYIERTDKISTATKEESLDCSEIYPSRVGKCSDVITVDTKKNLYDFVDDSIPANLDFNSYLIAGETMTVIFQTGMLAGDGKEFEVKYFHDSVNGKPARRFEIVPQEIDGITMPNETFKPKFGDDGDTYAVFGIQLPKEYICNDTDKSGASWDMMRETARKLYECEEQKFTFTGELQSMWAKRNWEHVGGKIVVGGYVLFTDNQFAPNGTPIRIVGIKDYITNPYAPTIELSNSITSPGSVASSLRQIDNTEVVIDDTKRDVMRFTKRRFRDALETIGMLEDAQLDNFNSAISPVAIQTMAMLVGDESLQFLMGKTIATIGSGDWSIGFKNNALTADAGFLRHMTIGVNSITASREMTEYLTWQMPAMNLTPKSSAKYYVYAVVNRSGFSYNETLGASICNTPGQWLMSESSHRIDENTGTYHLLVGVLNSEYNGERSFASLYGFTEILPGRITTESITSSDGKSCFDMKNNAMHIGDAQTYFDWNNLIKNMLSIRNASIRIDNSKGDTSVLFDSEDGHGVLACGNIEWDEFGNTHIKGAFSQSIIPIENSDASTIEMEENAVTKYKLNKHLYLLTCRYMYYTSAVEELPRYSYYDHTIVLPEDISYVGKVVRIYNANFGPYSRTVESFASTSIEVENDGKIVGIPPIYATTVYDAGGWDKIRIMGGYAEFVGLPYKKWVSDNKIVDATRWICIQYNGVAVEGYKDGKMYGLSHQFSTTE